MTGAQEEALGSRGTRVLGVADPQAQLDLGGPHEPRSDDQGLADSACLRWGPSPPGSAARGLSGRQWLAAGLWSQTYVTSKLCDLISLSLCFLTCKMERVVVKIKHK